MAAAWRRGEGRIFENLAVPSLSYFNRLEEMPVFTSRNFYSVCMIICASSDPPPLKWSDLRYVFDIKEDCNGKEAIQA